MSVNRNINLLSYSKNWFYNLREEVWGTRQNSLEANCSIVLQEQIVVQITYSIDTVLALKRNTAVF